MIKTTIGAPSPWAPCNTRDRQKTLFVSLKDVFIVVVVFH